MSSLFQARRTKRGQVAVGFAFLGSLALCMSAPAWAGCNRISAQQATQIRVVLIRQRPLQTTLSATPVDIFGAQPVAPRVRYRILIHRQVHTHVAWRRSAEPPAPAPVDAWFGVFQPRPVRSHVHWIARTKLHFHADPRGTVVDLARRRDLAAIVCR